MWESHTRTRDRGSPVHVWYTGADDLRSDDDVTSAAFRAERNQREDDVGDLSGCTARSSCLEVKSEILGERGGKGEKNKQEVQATSSVPVRTDLGLRSAGNQRGQQ